MKLELRNVSCGYSEKEPPVQKNINFTVETGEICCLLGPNGVGKSTLIRCITGHIKPDSGKVSIFGRDVRDYRLDELAKEAGLTKEETILALEADGGVESLDAGRETEDGGMLSLGERIVRGEEDGRAQASLTIPSRDAEKEKLLDHMLLKQLWEGLSKEEQKIIWLRYFRDKTQTEVSRDLGISQVQVSRKEKRILEKMRQNAIS